MDAPIGPTVDTIINEIRITNQGCTCCSFSIEQCPCLKTAPDKIYIHDLKINYMLIESGHFNSEGIYIPRAYPSNSGNYIIKN